ncbi:hypothetical protein FRX31_019382 [Thalictrum thalictroides]|uniref:Uncharacterized protein n=1 Tax=Thalictrum thalictroides TaxID=46969 RepID=A0A7J6W0Z2_THATH|nr:hypothetical protein FRX31_019382 [Thalictrum thalictroides]
MIVAFSIKPVKAEHIAMYKRALPPKMCHGIIVSLVATDGFDSQKEKNLNSHCSYHKSSYLQAKQAESYTGDPLCNCNK